MAVALQIRDVPDEIRDTLAARAGERGQSMQAFLLEIVEREARLMRNVRMFETTANQRVTIPDELSPERIIREARDAGFDADHDQDRA
jgi:plasmid stability protein